MDAATHLAEGILRELVKSQEGARVLAQDIIGDIYRDGRGPNSTTRHQAVLRLKEWGKAEPLIIARDSNGEVIISDDWRLPKINSKHALGKYTHSLEITARGRQFVEDELGGPAAVETKVQDPTDSEKPWASLMPMAERYAEAMFPPTGPKGVRRR